MNISQIYKYCLDELSDSQEKYIETEMLLSYILKKDRLFIKLNFDYDISKLEEIKIKEAIADLKRQKPIHYITKSRDFFGIDFFVEEGVLIPRSDTEILVNETILAIKEKFQDKKIKGLEIGVGSGIISLSLLKNIDNLNMTAIDINKKALKLSEKNAKNLNLSKRINLIESNLYDNLNDKFDFIISNPPYIKTKDIEKLSKKIKDFEPIEALDAKEDGLYFYDNILKYSKNFLNKDFCIFFEIGYNQAEDVKKIFDFYNFRGSLEIIKDYSSYDRVVVYKN